MTLYLFNFNNYYNRIVKRFETIDEYENAGNLLDVQTGINFNPNDNITTTQIINYNQNTTPDYLICSNENDEIVSRWYILETTRTRAGQYQINLLRDVIADWYTEILNAPIFVEKAMLPISDPGIYNNEAMDFNQIKESETLLTDITKSPWIVGYIDRKMTNKSITIPSSSVKVDYTTTLGEGESAIEAARRIYPNGKYTSSSPMKVNSNENIRIVTDVETYSGINYRIAWNQRGYSTDPILAGDTYVDEFLYKNSLHFGGYTIPLTQKFLEKGISYLAKEYASYASDISWIYSPRDYMPAANIQSVVDGQSFIADNGKIIKAGDFYYRIEVHETKFTVETPVNVNSALGLSMRRVAQLAGKAGLITYDASIDNALYYQADLPAIYCVLVPISVESFTVEIPVDRLHPSEVPYDIFCMPYGAVNYYGTGMTSRRDTSAELALKVAQTLIVELGAQLYDIQLLPYCPLDLNRIFTTALGEKVFLASNFPDKTFTTIIDDTGECSFLGWLEQSSFTRYLDFPITTPSNNIDFKVANECDLWRISSPNYSSSFEFSVCKNKGVNRFRIDCSYKPYSPYIRCAPEFGGLYGNIQDDARGLICGGDFSLAQVNDAWVNYQLNNKNYNEIFNRQLDNMRFQNDITRKQETINIATGALTAGVTTGIAVGMVNPTAGLIAGGVGAAASALGGLQDRYYNDQLRREAIDYTKDQFGYQLSNIRAQPTVLEKVSTFNPNNKIFPVLEKFTATNIEKQALRDKILYNGMSVGRIGTISQFIQPSISYIKGKLIRLTDIDGNYLITTAISNELNKGVFI